MQGREPDSRGDTVEAPADRQAFARARSYLNYHPVAKWSALLAAVGTGVLYVALLVFLWLYADLMVYRGRIPSFSDLPEAQQQEFLTRWTASDPEQRQKLKVEKRQRLVDLGLDESAADALAAADPTKLKPAEVEWLWRTHLYQLLNERSGPAAAGAVVPSDNPEKDLEDRGILSLVVRTRSSLVGSVTGALARRNAWTWQTHSAKHANFFYYLSGLLGIAIVLALLRAVLTYVNEDMAARAATEASSRMRRAVYHHTFRLGTLAIRALGPSE